jgi:hypothetical protein
MPSENPVVNQPTLQDFSTMFTRFASLKSTWIAVGIISLVIVVASGLIGSAFRKGVIHDKKRQSDFSNIQTNIQQFYTSHNNTLPENLDELNYEIQVANTSRFGRSAIPLISTTDPETNKTYDYKILSDYSYQLCTTFSTQSKAKQSVRLSIYTSNTKTDHVKGYDCLTYEIPQYYRRNYRNPRFPTPSPTRLRINSFPTPRPTLVRVNLSPLPARPPYIQPFKFIQPQLNDRLCIGNQTVIVWEAENKISKIRLRISQNNNGKAKSYRLKPDLEIDAGLPLNPQVSDSRIEGSMIWKIGDIISADNKLAEPGIYHLEAIIFYDDLSESYYNNTISLSDCGPDISPTLNPEFY